MKDTRSFEQRYRTLDDPPPPVKPLVVPDLETHLKERRLPMVTLNTVLMVLAFLFLVLAAVGVQIPRVSAGWIGLAFWVLAILLSGRG